MSPQAPEQLRTLAVKSAAWYGAARLWSQGVSWAVTILLARLLVPDDYGLLAMALSVLALLEVLQEFGLGTAIVQRQDVTRQQLNTMFWIVAGTSLTLSLCTSLAADSIGRFYGEPRLVWILRALCVTFVLNSLGMVPYNLLTRAINLRQRSLAEAAGATASAVVALGLAHLGYGVWALVLGNLARAFVLNGALAIFAGWIPGLGITRDGMGGLFGFGLRIAGTQLVSSLTTTLTTFVLARFLGGAALGLYTVAQSLAEAPHRLSTAIITQVSLPVFARLQRDRDRLVGHFLKISKYLAIVSLPVQTGLVLIAPDLVPVLLAAKWLELVVPFQIFCVEGGVVFLTLSCSPLLGARGRADILFRLSMAYLVVMSLVAVVGAQFGLVAVTGARLAAIAVFRTAMLVFSLRELAVTTGQYLGHVLMPALATGVMAGAVLLAQHLLYAQAGHLERVVVAVLVGAVTYPLALLALDRRLTAEVRIIAVDLFSTSKA